MDPRSLPPARLVNLIYYCLSEGKTAEDRKKLDQDLLFVGEERDTGIDTPPSWWGSDEEAEQSGLAMARAMGLKVNIPNGEEGG